MKVPFAAFVVLLVALLGTLTATEMVRAFAHRLRAIDTPGGRRSHRRPTARMGGLGIFWGFSIALLVATYGFPGAAPLRGEERGVLGMLAGGALMLVVGMTDDVRGLRPWSKLAFQFAGAGVLWGAGWRIDSLGLPGVGAWSVGNLSFPFTVAWVLLVTNAVNLIDGLDGLACGLALIATATVCALVWPASGPMLVAAAAFAGALAGFLWFNLNPAMIFMGDAGSLFVGFVLAALTLRAGELGGPEATPLVPALLLAVPLFDTLDTVRRRLAGAWVAAGPRGFARAAVGRVFAADGLHVHHRFTRAGLTTRRAVAWLWLAATMFAFAAWMVVRDPRIGIVVLTACVGLGAWGWGHVRSRSRGARPASRPGTGDTMGAERARAEAERRAA